jgi:O-antigen/teichoic acid export membrane protein
LGEPRSGPFGGVDPGHVVAVNFPSSVKATGGASPSHALRDEGREASLGSAVRLSAEAAARLLGVATTLFIARGLGPADFGLFAAFLGVAAIASEAGDLGLQTTASRALVAGTLPLRALVAAKLLLTALLWLAALALSRVHPILAPLVLWVSLGRWSEFLGVALRARGWRSAEAAVLVCLRGAGLAAVLLAVPHGWTGGASPHSWTVGLQGLGIVVLSWRLALSSLAALALGVLLVARMPASPHSRMEGAGLQTRNSTHGLGAALRASLPLGVNGVLALASLRVELLVLAFTRSDGEAGVFAAAFKVVEFLMLVPSAIAAGAMPALTREALRGESRAVLRTAATVALLAVPAATGIALVAPGLVPRVFGAAYAGGATPLRVLALAVVPMFLNTVLLHVLVAWGKAGVLPGLTAARLLLAAALAAILIPPFGVLGAALGLALAETALTLLAARACAKGGIPVRLTSLLALAAAASIPMAVATALRHPEPVQAALLGAAVYAATLAAAVLCWPRLRRLSIGAGLGYP